MKKFIFLFSACFLMAIQVGLQAQTSEMPAGEGTESNPYQISNPDNLYWLSQTDTVWNKYFIQNADINAADTKNWNSGAGFTPIGNNVSKFTGTYHGQSHEIDSLYIIRPNTDNIGLFGYIQNATIDSLGITNDSIVGKNYVGSLVGNERGGSEIKYCSATGIVRAKMYVGGFAGNLSSDKVAYCYAHVEVIGSSISESIGGFAGVLLSTVNYCYASGNVTGNAQVGGFVGLASDPVNERMIFNCYARGSVTGITIVGGFMGKAYHSGAQNCYCTGFVSGPSSACKGFLGMSYYAGTITQSYWDTITTGQSIGYTGVGSFQCEGKSTAEMQQQNTYENWDFRGETINGTEDVWTINSTQNDGYPFFYDQISVSTLAVTDSTDTSAWVHGQLYNFWNVNITSYGACWNTTGNPDIFDNYVDNGSLNSRQPWTVQITGLNKITTYYVRAYAISVLSDTVYGEVMSFRTTLPGKGTINNPYLIYSYDDLKEIVKNRSACYKQIADIDAVASQTENGGEGFEPLGNSSHKFTGTYLGQAFIIDNLYINRNLTNNIGLFGYLSGAKIIQVVLSNASITGYEYVGGIAGRVESTSEIRLCNVTGTVSGGRLHAGGIAGYVSNSIVSLSWSAADVTVIGTEGNAGGLIGRIYESSIDNCYATGTVTIPGIPQYAAGLVAFNYATTVSNCYSTGLVAASTLLGGSAGGLLAFNNSTVSNSFWDVQTSEKSSSQGGTGKTTAQMKTLSTFTNAGWDFSGETANGAEDHWDMNVSVNSGYPFIRTDFYPAQITTELDAQYVDYMVVKGVVTNLGNPIPIQHGICWNTSGSPTIDDEKTERGLITTIGEYSKQIANLEINTTYYVRTYISNREGTTYGNEIVVKSSDGAGGCMYFDGVDALIRIDNDPGISVGNTFSVEVWVMPLSLSLRYAVYSTIRYAGIVNGYQIEVGPANNGTNCVSVYNTGVWHAQTENNVIENNKWNHIVYSRESGDQQKIFVNGSQVSLVATNNSIIIDNSYDRAIGDGLSSLVHNFYGYIDELRIWNYALTQEEIRERMHKVLTGNEPGLAEYWKFDKRSGLTTSDEKVNRTCTFVSMDSTTFIASTAPIPFVSDEDGRWTDDSHWRDGQGYPVNAWSRVEINSNISLAENLELIDLTIKDEKKLTLSPGTELTVTGNLLNNAGISGLILQSDASGTASLLHQSEGVNASAERYIPAFTDAAGWHYLSSPVVHQPIRPEFVSAGTPDPNTDFYKFSEPQYLWISTKDNSGDWNNDFENEFVVGRGYNVAYPSDVTKTFTGELNVGDIILNESSTPAITFTENGGSGWNLVGNPFPCAIDWDDCIKTNIDGAVYAFDGENGQYLSWNGTVGELTDGIIPPMNGFFIKASTTPSLTMPNTARRNTSADFLKDKSYVKDLLVLKVEGNGFKDKTFISFTANATTNFDKDFDAYKLSGVSQAPQLYTKTGDIKLSINELPYSDDEIIIPLSLKVGNDGDYTLSVAQNTFWETVSISLKDLETQITYNLITNNSITINQSTNNSPDRFLLLINGATSVNEIQSSDNEIEIYSWGNTIYILAADQEEIQVSIINLLGQTVAESSIEGSAANGTRQIEVNLSGKKGFFVVNARTLSSMKTKKIYLW